MPVAQTLTSHPRSGGSGHQFGRSILYGAVAAAVLVTLTVGGMVISGGQNNTPSGPGQGDIAKVVPTPPPTHKPAKTPAPAATTTANGQAVYRVGDAIAVLASASGTDRGPAVAARLRVLSITPWRGDSRWRPTCAGCRAISAEVSIQVTDAGSGGHAFCLATSAIVAVSATDIGTTPLKGARSPALQLGCRAAGSSDRGFLTYLLLSGQSFDHLEIQTAAGVVALVRP